MGYTTDFDGVVNVVPPLNEAERTFLEEFSATRRMHRSGGPLFVKGEGQFGQGAGPDTVFKHNESDPEQPGLWCQWVPTDDGTAIEWDGNEKFYNAAEWMAYIVHNLFAPSARQYIDDHMDEDSRLSQFTCDHVINGEIDASGEESGDLWKILVQDNVVSVVEAQIVYSGTPVVL